MMEEVLYGCDVMPSAVHITGSTLSGVEPAEVFEKSRLYTMPYGRQSDGTVAIGSLELLQSSSVLTLFNTNDPAMRTGSAGEETAAQVRAEIPDEGYDLVIMNPPFTRNTNKAGDYADKFAGAFAAFNSTRKDQRDMSSRMAKLRQGTCYHGHAGMASAFAGLAHRKLKPGGVLALVLPLTATAGLSWQAFRKMLADHYTGLTVLSIATAGNDELAFSSDTGMADCLAIARKLKEGESSNSQAHFTSLRRRPQGFAHASSMSARLLGGNPVRRIEDGPYGGTPLMIGGELAGHTLAAPQGTDGASWGAVRLADYSLAQSAYALVRSRLWLPGDTESKAVPVALLRTIAKTGFHHLDITGYPSGGPPQGPFDKTVPSPTATYPALWNHNAKNETRLVCAPDSQLTVRQGMEDKANAVWATAGRPHLTLDFRFNSQPLAVALTEQRRHWGPGLAKRDVPDKTDTTTHFLSGETAHWDCCATGGTPAASNRAKRV